MSRRIAETNVVQFEHNILNIFKYNASLAINEGCQLTICSPFKTYRALSGLHTQLYKSSITISKVGHVFFDARFLAQYLGEEYPYEFVKESFYLVLDKRGTFSLLDCPRAVIISTFELSTISGEIVGFTGHPENLGEFAVITDDSLYVTELLFDDAKIIDTIPMVGAKQIETCQNGYLVRDRRGLVCGKDVNVLYSNNSIEEFRVCQHVIAAAIPVKGNNYKIQIIGGQAFGLANLCPHCWDITNGYIIALHDGHHGEPQSISFTRVDIVSRRASINLTNKMQGPIALFADSSSFGDTINIIVFTEGYAVTIRVPLSDLRT